MKTLNKSIKQIRWRKYLPITLSFCFMLTGILIDYFASPGSFSNYLRLGLYILAYLPVGFPVLKEAFNEIKGKNFFNEFTLMSIATLGAFFIGEYPEGVAVMLFYSIGELFQDSAVDKARKNIKDLLDVRPSVATVLRGTRYETIRPEDVAIGETIQIKAGEKVPLDGVLLSASGSFNTSALTGESVPKTIRQGESVLAGMLSVDKVVELKVEKEYSDSSLAKILEMVENASSKKAKTEVMIRKFAKIYTPIVFLLALAIIIIPFFFVSDYVLQTWVYRALVFLVISCPCALVISIPLGYFGGIGAASRHGILFKGANYLDLMTSVNTVVMDKTGTLTKGVFEVQEVVSEIGDSLSFVSMIAAVESGSTHPIAKAIVEYSRNQTAGIAQKNHSEPTDHSEPRDHSEPSADSEPTEKSLYVATDVQEIAGYGLKANVNGKEVLVGNAKLLEKQGILYDKTLDKKVETIVIAAIDGKYAGYITIADEVKEDSATAILKMKKLGIKQTLILSGDKSSITEQIAKTLGIDRAYGDLLPGDKVKQVEELKANPFNIIAFVGDGINDAPVLALSDVGIAMGGMGSDAAIEIADVVIQTDEPSKIAMAIEIAKATKKIVIQNIIMAFSVKIVVMCLGAFGIATMWEAVFADVGVSLLAILNAVRILRKEF